jgi:hypothetical protein
VRLLCFEVRSTAADGSQVGAGAVLPSEAGAPLPPQAAGADQAPAGEQCPAVPNSQPLKYGHEYISAPPPPAPCSSSPGHPEVSRGGTEIPCNGPGCRQPKCTKRRFQ